MKPELKLIIKHKWKYFQETGTQFFEKLGQIFLKLEDIFKETRTNFLENRDTFSGDHGWPFSWHSVHFWVNMVSLTICPRLNIHSKKIRKLNLTVPLMTFPSSTDYIVRRPGCLWVCPSVRLLARWAAIALWNICSILTQRVIFSFCCLF